MTEDVDNPFASPATAETVPEVDADRIDRMRDQTVEADEAIVGEGALSREDFFASQRLARPSVLSHIVGAIVVIAATWTLLSFRLPTWLQALLVLAGVYVLAAAFIYPRWARARAWQQLASLRQPTRRLFSTELVQAITPQSNVILRWNTYSGYRHNDQVLLLYLADHPQMYMIVPRSSFADPQRWQQLIELVEQKLPAR